MMPRCLPYSGTQVPPNELASMLIGGLALEVKTHVTIGWKEPTLLAETSRIRIESVLSTTGSVYQRHGTDGSRDKVTPGAI